MPGNPVDQMIPPSTTDEGRSILRAELEKYFGLDKPLFVQYGDFWANLLRGNLGYAMMRIQLHTGCDRCHGEAALYLGPLG